VSISLTKTESIQLYLFLKNQPSDLKQFDDLYLRLEKFMYDKFTIEELENMQNQYETRGKH